MQLAGIHHVNISAPDVDAARDWYVEVLGFVPAPRPGSLGPGHWLDGGGQQLHISEGSGRPQSLDHFALRVVDLDAAVAELEGRGVEVFRIPLIPGAGHQAFVRDPFGNLVELNQPE
jgi:catechol 2,3-dioxygenase-like lactoylglutathione lyase family enzyme